MNKSGQDFSDIHLGIVGLPDFQRRVNAAVLSMLPGIKSFTALPGEAWGMVLTERPNALIFDIGLKHTERSHTWLKNFLRDVRARFTHDVYTIVALTACEKLAFGGDLLFDNELDLAPSNLVDTFLALAPSGIPSIASLPEQIFSAISLYQLELKRRARKKSPIPSLASENWVHSLAAPQSRELWMRWLPRYASYTNENPIILGLTGTGKTRLAHALHLLSDRPGPFVSITPRDFSSSELIQAELFGAVAGAYTGAVDKWGLVKSAEGGTLFIDELQSIDKDLQGKLITFIENKTYRRVGSAETTEADVRFVFATNQSIDQMVESDTLREDFAYRLERVQLDLLPLHLRRLDISAALAYALAKIRRQRPQAIPISGVTSSSYRLLFCHNWPGNLRQLENTVAQLCEYADMNEQTIIDDLAVTHVFDSRLSGTPATTAEIIAQASVKLARFSLTSKPDTIQDGLDRFKQELRVSALESCGGDSEKAAQLLEESPSLIGLFAQTMCTENEVAALNMTNSKNKNGGV